MQGIIGTHTCPVPFVRDPRLTFPCPKICQSFATRKRTFLEEEQWKAVPWAKTPKTALDSLNGILADMPGVVNDMAASEHPISPATRAAFHRKVGYLRMQLQQWRWAWHETHVGMARRMPSHLKLDGVDTPVFREQLSTMIEFDSTQQALEMLTYNAGLIYLMQLEDVLEMGAPHNAPLSAANVEYIRRAGASHPSTPLLLPDEARFICQPALEAFRLIPSLYKNLVTTRDRIMVILAPLGIVYCATQKHAELSRCMRSVLDDIPFFQGGAPKELSVYELTLGQEWEAKEEAPPKPAEHTCLPGATVALAL